jgi:hypothetical protein
MSKETYNPTYAMIRHVLDAVCAILESTVEEALRGDDDVTRYAFIAVCLRLDIRVVDIVRATGVDDKKARYASAKVSEKLDSDRHFTRLINQTMKGVLDVLKAGEIARSNALGELANSEGDG